ncbi:unnamed protein product [Calypogeia fissa]
MVPDTPSPSLAAEDPQPHGVQPVKGTAETVDFSTGIIGNNLPPHWAVSDMGRAEAEGKWGPQHDTVVVLHGPKFPTSQREAARISLGSGVRGHCACMGTGFGVQLELPLASSWEGAAWVGATPSTEYVGLV